MGRNEITLEQAAAWCGGRATDGSILFSGANFDTRRLRERELFVAIDGARDGHVYAREAIAKGAAAVLASKKLPEDIPAIYVTDTLRALQAIARGYRETLRCKCIGITGSVGKTTTKEMIASVLSLQYATEKTAENYNNGLGLPITVLGTPADCSCLVLEMGMNHFGEISTLTRIARPDIALITNIGTMHIENLGSREGIRKAKLEILEGLRENGTVIFNGDDAMLNAVAEQYHAIRFGFTKDCDVRAENVCVQENGSCFTAIAFGSEFTVELPVAGRHSILDALAAITVGVCCGVSKENIRTALREFRNTGMRQKIYSLHGVTVIEDCYNAGPESMRAALQVLAERNGRKIAVLGGMLELGEIAEEQHYEIGRIAAREAELLFAYGEHSDAYVRGARDAGMKQAEYYSSHEALADALLATLREGDILLIKGSRGMQMERIAQELQNENRWGKLK